MRLNEYLKENQIGVQDFLKILKSKPEPMTVSAVALYKWLRGYSIPTGKHLATIQRKTENKVQAIDFWNGQDK